MSVNYNKNKTFGSANSGLLHWKLQRLSAIFIMPLILWFIFSIVVNMSSEYEKAIEWIVNPINSLLLVILLAGIFYHSGMGLQVVFEDYISNINLRKKIITLFNVILFLFATISIVSVLKIVLY